MKSEVRFYHMIPEQIVRRREECPIAYLPVGTLEWHGSHLPFGTDCITVEYIAEQLALKNGGIAFPVMVYGDIRYNLHDSRKEWNKVFSEEMRISKELASTFVYESPDVTHYRKSEKEGFVSLPMSYREQEVSYIKLIAYTMMEIYRYGFKAIVILPGHGGGQDICRSAIPVFLENTECTDRLQPPPIVKLFSYLEFCAKIEPRLKKFGVHADKLETSAVMAIAPQDVRLEKLPEDPKRIPNAYLYMPYLDPQKGYSQDMEELWSDFDAQDPRNSTIEYGKTQMDYVVISISKEVNEIKHQLGIE